jgi:hypothetical protein
MKFMWRGNWRKGELLIETETLEELEAVMDKIFAQNGTLTTQAISSVPLLPAGLGCSDAVRTLLESDWTSRMH